MTDSERDIQQQAAASVTDTAVVDFEVTIADPGILRRIGLLPKRKRLAIGQIKTGVALLVAQELFSLDGFMETAAGASYSKTVYEGMAKHTDTLTRAIAIAIVNSKPGWWTRFRTWRMRRFIADNLSWREMLQLMTLVVRQMRIDDFFYTMALTNGMNMLKAGQAAGGEDADSRTHGKSSGHSSTISASDGTTSSGDSAGETS
jgi:hypothetical protein